MKAKLYYKVLAKGFRSRESFYAGLQVFFAVVCDVSPNLRFFLSIQHPIIYLSTEYVQSILWRQRESDTLQCISVLGNEKLNSVDRFKTDDGSSSSGSLLHFRRWCVTCKHLVHIWSMSMDAQLPTWSIGWTANVPDRWLRYGCTTPALVLFESLDFRLYVFQEHRKAFQQPCWDKLQPGSQLSAGLYTGTPVATRVGFILPYSSVVSDNTIRETSPAFHKAIQELIDRFKNVGCLAHWISNWTRRIY